jgi:hypothetical protein
LLITVEVPQSYINATAACAQLAFQIFRAYQTTGR